MKKRFKKVIRNLLLGMTGCCALASSAQAAGLITINGSQDPAVKIQSHHVVATIEDGYSITEVEQVFRNDNQLDLEAVYHFPVPELAAVSEFTVWIDDKPVVGEVLEKHQAKTVYEEEKASGRVAGITTKNKHYNFEIKVSPVRAGQDTRIRLVYMQQTDIDTGIGRYVYPLEDGGTDDQAMAFWTSDTSVQEDFSFKLNLRSGYPVAGVRVPAHPQATVTSTNSQEWQVSLGSQASRALSVQPGLSFDGEQETTPTAEATTAVSHGPVATLDKDIVTYWRHEPGLPGSVELVAHRQAGAERGTFMLSLTPGDDLARITEGRDWMFVLDMSGSMAGKYQTLTEGVKRALSALQPADRFRIIRFSNAPSELTKGWVNTTPDNVSYWSNELAATQTGGGTNLYAGTLAGLKALDADRTSALVLVTDGEANVGTTEKKQFLELMENYDVRLFTAVMGNGANRPLLDAMTEVSNGFAVSVSNSDDIVGKLMEATSKATHQAFHDVELKINGVKTADLTPDVTTTLYRGEQLVVLGHYWGEGEASVSLTGKISGQRKQYTTRFDFPSSQTSNPEIERLWAYAKIRELQNMMDYLDDDSEYKSAVVDIAVAHGLVTDHTSMVVMRNEQFEARGIERQNRDRRLKETIAAGNRSSGSVANNRVDVAPPAFSQPRASHGSSASGSSGGGALLYELLLLVSFVGLAMTRSVMRRGA